MTTKLLPFAEALDGMCRPSTRLCYGGMHSVESLLHLSDLTAN